MAGLYFLATAYDERLKKQTIRRCKSITDLYNDLIAAAVGIVPDTITQEDAESGFFFKNYPILHKRINTLLQRFASNLQTNIEDGNTDAWDISNAKYDALIKMIKDKADKAGIDISERLQKKWSDRNLSALEAFQHREVNGVKLSQRIWNLSQQTKQELELAMEIGIGDGKSAADLSRDVRKYLKDPNKLFRRVRDKKTGQLRLSKAAAAYHPGRGKYRSSYKNALRMTATENNMAYRSADFERNQELDFVLGIEIHLSGNHPVVDICDDLAGKYPKTFKFTGWHPWCRCYTTTILPKQEDMLNYLSMSAEEQAQTPFSGQITDFPDKFKGFITENEERLKNAKSVPLFVQDNKKAVEKILNPERSKPTEKPKLSIKERAKMRHEARTEADIARIREDWYNRRMETDNLHDILDTARNDSIEHRSVDLLPKSLSSDEIVSRLGGGDLTKGSCSSLAFAYIGNRGGLDVLDFRDGASRKFFANSAHIKSVVEAVNGTVIQEYSDFKAANALFKQVESGKEYYFCTGSHAAVIRKVNDSIEYLELQSATRNGWHPLDKQTLKWRFSAKMSRTYHGHKYKCNSCLCDAELLQKDKGYRELLGFINTSADKQVKGTKGVIK